MITKPALNLKIVWVLSIYNLIQGNFMSSVICHFIFSGNFLNQFCNYVHELSATLASCENLLIFVGSKQITFYFIFINETIALTFCIMQPVRVTHH